MATLELVTHHRTQLTWACGFVEHRYTPLLTQRLLFIGVFSAGLLAAARAPARAIGIKTCLAIFLLIIFSTKMEQLIYQSLQY